MVKIQITNTYKGDVLDIVRSCVPEGFEISVLPENSTDALMECVEDADYILASGRVRITADVLDRAKNLKMIQRTGVGLDSLDLDAIRQRKIPLYVNKGVNSQSVAEHSLLLILSCMRNLAEINRNVKNGIWEKQAQGIKTFELSGKTVGIIGMGSIGKSLAQLLCGFGCRIIYYDKYKLSSETEAALNAEFAEINRLFEASDVVSLNCPLNDESRYLIRRETIDMMKNGCILVNTARGGLICENDLADALECGKIRMAGLDVYENEPVKPENRLLKLKNVILTPHIGGITYDSFHKMISQAMRNISLFEQKKTDDIADSRYI